MAPEKSAPTRPQCCKILKQAVRLTVDAIVGAVAELDEYPNSHIDAIYASVTLKMISVLPEGEHFLFS